MLWTHGLWLNFFATVENTQSSLYAKLVEFYVEVSCVCFFVMSEIGVIEFQCGFLCGKCQIVLLYVSFIIVTGNVRVFLLSLVIFFVD
ncbi:hypothetical protein RIF29_22138 [Crotalaria pallida]|uniref:Uncharacterized protein n=1 Tax=Crotalaria pallida TaxID=3830 RepID=A0AAN9F444_CROPI